MDKISASKRDEFYRTMYMWHTISSFTGNYVELEQTWTKRKLKPDEFCWESHRMHNFICEELNKDDKVDISSLWEAHLAACRTSESRRRLAAYDEGRSPSPSLEDLEQEND